MARITDAELDGLLEIIGEVHHAEDLDGFRQAVLEVLPRVIPAPMVSYNEVGFDGVPGVTLSRPPALPHEHELWQRLAPQNPLLRYYLETRDGRPTRFSDVISRRELEALEIYQELYRPRGFEHQMATVMLAPDRTLIGLVLSGPEDFTDGQRAIMDLARPHLIQAYSNARRRPSLRGYGLTPREAEVLRAMTRGRSTREIAAALGISERTVHKHAERIYAKLGVRDRVAAVSSVLAR